MRVACLRYRYMEKGIMHASSDDYGRWIRTDRRISQLRRRQTTQKPNGRKNPHVLRGHLRRGANATAGMKFQAFVHVGIDSAPSFLLMQCQRRMHCRSKILATNGTGSNDRRQYYIQSKLSVACLACTCAYISTARRERTLSLGGKTNYSAA